MERIILQNGQIAAYYVDELPAENAKEDYISVELATGDRENALTLAQRGFLFADRRVVMEMPLKNFHPMLKAGKRFSLSVTDRWEEEEIFRVARESFERDPRFALDPRNEAAALKNELLYHFISSQKQQGLAATCLRREGQLEGFNLWQLQDGVGCIRLGAMSAQYQGTGVAMALYSHTLNAMREDGALLLRDLIMASNTSSLNLHAVLVRCAGGEFHFGTGRDYYLKG